MRSLATVVVAAALLLGGSGSAQACDPYWDWCGYEWYDPYWDVPAYEVPSWTWWSEPARGPAPEWSEPVAWIAPGSDVLDSSVLPVEQPSPVALAPDPNAAAAELGLHTVTSAFAGHVTTTEGPVTSYSSATVEIDAGTKARLVATVATGESSHYDGAVIGGRNTLTDGRFVAGEIYENYVWNGYAWVLDAYVFFQDDSETARSAAVVPQDPVTPVIAPPVAFAPDPVSVNAALTTAVPSPAPIGPAYVAPVTEDPIGPVTTSPPLGEAGPAQRVVRAGLALAPQGDTLGRIEVMRGRRVSLWVRATVDGAPAGVVGWSLLAGELEALGPISGAGEDPLVATWRSVTPPGGVYTVRVRAGVEVPGDVARDIDVSIDVVVRAPAVVD